MRDLTWEEIGNINQKTEQVVDCIIKEYLLEPRNPNARFKKYIIQREWNKETYYYNDGTDDGLFLCSIETIMEGDSVTLKVVMPDDSIKHKVDEILNDNIKKPTIDQEAFKKLILGMANDAGRDFVYHDREECEDLSNEQLVDAINSGLVTKEDITNAFWKGVKFED